MRVMRCFQLGLIGLALATSAKPLRAQDRLQDPLIVVASFSILGDFVKNVGGERVNVTTLVGPDGDVHVYAPAPADARKIADAKLLVINGLRSRGLAAAALAGCRRQGAGRHATKGIAPLKSGSDADPHAWQSVANAKKYVANIRDALAAADPADAEVFRKGAEAYLAKLDALDREAAPGGEPNPERRRKVISTHDAFGYFAAAYGIQFIAPLAFPPNPRRAPATSLRSSPRSKPKKFRLFSLKYSGDPRLIRRISAETGAKVGGTLFSDSLTGEKGDAPTYIDMVRHNIKALTSALAD